MNSPLTEPAQIAQKVTLVGMALDTILGIAKIIVGLLFYSYSLVADGIHSLSDMVTDVFVLIITRISHHGPDDAHPYGHARFETLGTVILGGILITVALALAYSNAIILYEAEPTPVPGWPTLVIAAISVFSKEWIFHYTKRAGEQLRSNLLIANAWHSRTDAFSSILVLVGIGGAMLGVPWLDSAAAIAVAIIIAKIGWKLAHESLEELVDTGLTPEKTEEIKAFILQHEGVRGVHDLRTRRMGQDVFLDLHIRVNPDISVSEGHQIGEWVHKKLLDRYDYIHDLTYHIDAEDDNLIENRGRLLPLREAVLHELQTLWRSNPIPGQIQQTKLHYLNNKIDIEIFIEGQQPDEIHKLPAALRLLKANTEHLDWLGKISLWVKPCDNQESE